MKATVLIDNITQSTLTPEWGLSFYIEHEGRIILLDTGASGRFAANAKSIGKNLSLVEYGVLSHAHYDHSDGLEAFFAENSRAKFYLQKSCAENCFSKKLLFSRYIGIKRGTLERFSERIEYVSGVRELFPGAYLCPHFTPNLADIGKKAGMYVRYGRKLKPDDFSHEQSLVLDTFAGLVIFNSCSHGRADNIIKEVGESFKGKKIRALIGGLHLFESDAYDIRELAKRVKQTGIEELYTGHCTGDRAAKILCDELGGVFHGFYTGAKIEI